MGTIGDRVRALRERCGMTGGEVAELGGIGNASQVSKVENGHNNASTLNMRVGLAKGFGLTFEEMNAYLDERVDVEKAFRLGFPRISSKLQEIREKNDMAHQEELEEAIQRLGGPVKVGAFAIEPARELARRGLHQSVDAWMHTIRYLQATVERILSGKANER